MFGDYYTPNLLSGSPNTTMIGNQIDLYISGGQQKPVGAALVCVLMALLLLLMLYYLIVTARMRRGGTHEHGGGATGRSSPQSRASVGGPWGRPRFLLFSRSSTSSGRSSRS